MKNIVITDHVFERYEFVSEKNGDKILKIRFYTQEKLKIFFNYMYNYDNIFMLKRKYDKFNDYYKMKEIL